MMVEENAVPTVSSSSTQQVVIVGTVVMRCGEICSTNDKVWVCRSCVNDVATTVDINQPMCNVCCCTLHPGMFSDVRDNKVTVVSL